MPDPIPSCFRGAAVVGPPASTAAGPTVTTSVYETPVGLAALSWSRTVLGLLVRAELRLDGDGNGGLDQDRPLSFKIRPWLFFARRGSKRFSHRSHSIDFVWDLTRAKFPSSGGPEPAAGFFLSIAVDGEIILIAGDLEDQAFKKMKQKKRELSTTLVSRREHVTMREDRRYRTQARFGGKERTISIDLGGEMSLEVDGKQILQIRRLRWKFRGSERVQLDGGDRIQLSWDLHNWLFQSKDNSGGGDGDRSSTGNATFVFRFETDETNQGHFGKKGEEYFGKEGVSKATVKGYFGKNKNWSDSSSGGGGGENGKKKNKNSSKSKILLKTSSFSSSSSASSAASSSVMEWASPEENELKNKEGFSLVVYAWKS